MASAKRLAELGMVPALAKEVANQIGGGDAYSVLRRILANADRCMTGGDNAVSRPASGAANIAINSSPDAGLTKVVDVYKNGSLIADEGIITVMGGKPLNVGNNNLASQHVTNVDLNGSPTGGNLGGGGRVQYTTAVEVMWRPGLAGSGKLDIGTANSSSPMRFIVDDQYVSKSNTVNGTANPCYTNLDFTLGGTVTVAALVARGPRRVRVEWSGDLSFRGFRGSPSDVFYPIPVKDVINLGWVGDSIAADTGNTLPGNSWPHTAAKLLGCRSVQQIAIGSTGYVVSQPGYGTGAGNYKTHINDLVMATRPLDALVISGGNNDANVAYEPLVQGNALDYFKSARALLPKVPIIVVGPNGASGATNVEALLQAAVAQSNDPMIMYVPTATATPQIYDGVTLIDAIHPDDNGHQLLGFRSAAGIVQAISNFLRVKATS